VFITVGTYPRPNAYAVLAAARKIASARVQAYGSNVIAVSYSNRPHSVYVAHRGSSSMIEVFAPTNLGAETIVRAGLIVPVRWTSNAVVFRLVEARPSGASRRVSVWVIVAKGRGPT
jgi:hypothetical protein